MNWKTAWHSYIVPRLSTESLKQLGETLRSNSSVLIQDQIYIATNTIIVRCCPLAFCGAIDQGGLSQADIGEVRKFYNSMLSDLHDSGAARCFLVWWDNHSRSHVVRELLVEVDKAIDERIRQSPN